MSTELEQVTTAVAEINKVEAGLEALRKSYAGVIYDVTTTEGMEAAKVARRAIREPRLEVEKIRKAAKAPILALGKKLDSEAARITRELTLIEDPIHLQITAEEDRKEREKQAKIDAELARVAAIQKLIDGIRNWPINAAGKPSALVNQMLQSATDYRIEEEQFQERTEEAKTVLIASTAALQGIYQQALTQEAEAAKLEADRKELERLRAEQAERDRLAREAQAKADAEAKAERDRQEAIAKAKRDAEAEELRKERAENERIARERQAELDKQARAQAEANAAETKRIAEERARLAADQEAARRAAEPKPEPVKGRKVTRPTTDEIVSVIADHWKVSLPVARSWISHAKAELESA